MHTKNTTKVSLDKEILTLKEVAAFLNVSPFTIRRMIKRDGIPAHKVGKKWVFIKEEVIEWLKAK